MKLKQFTDIKHIRIVKVIQIILFLFVSYYFAIKHQLLDVFPLWLGVDWLLVLLLPYEYRGRLNIAQKNVWLKNINPITEFVLIQLLLILIFFIMVFVNLYGII